MPVVVLLGCDDERYEVRALLVGGELFEPEQSPSWELARYFALLAANYRLVLGTHGQLHFSHDIIIVLTKTMMPQGHLIHRLLKPHGRFTLGLDSGVMNHRRSVAHNDQRELFTPFAVPRETIKELFAEARVGRPESPHYPPYRYGQQIIGDHTAIGRSRGEWYRAFRDFVEELLSVVPTDDPYLAPWADELSRWVPAFPSGAEIARPGVLAHVLAIHLATISVFHTTDHHSYSQIPLQWLPFRLRATSPHLRVPDRTVLDSLVTREDYFRGYLAHRMFFKPVVIEPLSDIRYPFVDARACQAASRFHQKRERLDARWANTPFPTTERIAVGVQY